MILRKSGGLLVGRAQALPCRHVVSLSTAGGMFFGFGLVPLAVAPPVHADVVDDVIDEMLAPFIDTSTNAIDWDSVSAPDSWEAFFSPAHWDAVTAELAGLNEVAAPVLSAAYTSDFTEPINALYTPLHAGAEAWIHSDIGRQVDGFVNTMFGSYVIGDGAAGTVEHPDGGVGGWPFGDGGVGWASTTANVAGGHGGAAGFVGDGGAGGHGGAGAAGGDGGAGGRVIPSV